MYFLLKFTNDKQNDMSPSKVVILMLNYKNIILL